MMNGADLNDVRQILGAKSIEKALCQILAICRTLQFCERAFVLI